MGSESRVWHGLKRHLCLYDAATQTPLVHREFPACEHFKAKGEQEPHPESLCVTCTLAREYGHFCRGRFTAMLYPVSDRVDGGVEECKFYDAEPKPDSLCDTCCYDDTVIYNSPSCYNRRKRNSIMIRCDGYSEKP